jgi:threonylcarbamoyladenosine tRNA methylthiotransferase MtaB
MGSLEPWDLPEDFFDLWSDSRLCPHLHLPLQSGSDSVLRRMARRCSVEEYRAIIGQAREAQPAFNITTDLIVGFPGETEAEFQETVANIGTMGFGHMHIFAYSRRAGTPAARMPKHVSRELKHERSKLIHEIAAEMKAAQFKRNIGEERLVLWEKPKPGETDSTQRLQGYTDNYFRVQMSAPANEVWYNKITPVRLLKLGEGGRFNGALV